MNFFFLLPVIVVVFSNVLYHISSKSTSPQANPFLSLVFTYLISTTVSFIIYIISCKGAIHIVDDFKKLNWATFAMGVVIIGLEAGWILAYRAGWNISKCSLVANITLAIILAFVGLIFYKEQITLKQFAGMAFCVVGLLLMNV